MSTISETRVQEAIKYVCDNIKKLLLTKNRKYGNSALDPIRIFSKLDAIEGLRVRIDDKLTRIKNMGQNNIEDTDESINDSEQDLIGYLVLKRVLQIVNKNEVIPTESSIEIKEVPKSDPITTYYNPKYKATFTEMGQQ